MGRYWRVLTPDSLLRTPHLLCAFLLIAPPALAQDEHRSHIPVPLPAGVDPARLFRERVQEAQLQTLADLVRRFKAVGPGRNAEQLRNLLQNNPQFQKLLESPEGQHLLNKARQEGKLPAGLTPEVVQRNLDEYLKTHPPPTIRPMPQSAEEPPISEAEQARKREWAEKVAQWTERLPESVRNSPALKDGVQRLTESAAEALRNSGGGPDGLDALARLETRLEFVRKWLPKEMPAALRNLRMPDLSRFAPNVRLPHLEMNPPELPSTPHLVAAEMDARAVGNGLLAGVGVMVLAAVVWRLLGGRLAPSAGRQRVLGPWPLDPARVASRVELIQAFEYLSLLRCGEPARSWHHRAIAECLSGSEAGRREAAARLAELYEQARYAPANGGEPDWSTAREPLSLLAETQ